MGHTVLMPLDNPPRPRREDMDPAAGNVAVILARIEAMLEGALREQTAHRTLLDQLATSQAAADNRLTRLETRTDNLPGKVDALENTNGIMQTAMAKLPTRASLNAAYGVAIAAIGALISFLALFPHK